MHAWRRSAFLAGALGLALAVGCSTAEPPAPDAKPAAGKASPAARSTPPIEQVDLATLPKLTGGLPPLDEGRLQIDTPDGWRAARQKGYVARLQLSGAKYPLILIQSEPALGKKDLTRKNVGEYAATVQAALDKELAGQGVELAKDVAPVQIGGFVGVEYQRRAHTDTVTLDRLFLVTVAEGRRYTLELRALTGTLRTLRPEFLAMAASMKVHRAGVAAGAKAP